MTTRLSEYDKWRIATRLSEYDKWRIGQIIAGEGDWFAACLLRLINKADAVNRALLAEIYPEHVEAVERWRKGPRDAV